MPSSAARARTDSLSRAAASSSSSSPPSSLLPAWLASPSPATRNALIGAQWAWMAWLVVFSTPTWLVHEDDYAAIAASLAVLLLWYYTGKAFLRRRHGVSASDEAAAAMLAPPHSSHAPSSSSASSSSSTSSPSPSPSPPPSSSSAPGSPAQPPDGVLALSSGAAATASGDLAGGGGRAARSSAAGSGGPDVPGFRRARAYLLQLLVSSALTVGSLWPTIAVLSVALRGDGDLWLALTHTDGTWPMRPLCVFFLVYLVLELTLGVLEYRESLFLGTCWAHHSAYIALLAWVLQRRYCGAFMALALNELPTVMLALGALHRPWRTDLAFGVVYAAVRLGFSFLGLALHVLLSRERAFAWLMALICAVHCVFFAQWLRSYRRLLANARKKESAVSAVPQTLSLPNF